MNSEVKGMGHRSSVKLTEVDNSDFFDSDVYLEDSYILLTPQTPLTDELRASLRTWGFDSVVSELVTPADLSAKITPHDIFEYEMGGMDREHVITVRKLYEDILAYLQTTYKALATEELLSPTKVAGRVKQLVDDVRSNRNYFLRFELLETEKKYNFIIESSVRVTILAILVGITLKLPIHRIIELGSATLLVKVGMLRIPADLYLSGRRLTPEERKILLTHPIVAYKRLKKSNFNPNICAAILDSNERLDGSGYPRKLNGNQITLFSRILAVCLFYVAKTFPRPGRTIVDGHYTILELLKMRDKQYDGTIIKALLENLSLYPIGTWVELANRQRGVVVAPSEMNPSTPNVKLLLTASGSRIGQQRVVGTASDEYRIVRALSPYS